MFFCNSMLQHMHLNMISSLRSFDGRKLETHRQISQELVQFFQNILSKSIAETNEGNPSNNLVYSPVYQKEVLHEIAYDEVKAMMKTMPCNKSQRLDGFTIDSFNLVVQ